MAIYHLHMQVISRSDGRSAVAAAAYRSASRLVDTSGKVFDFRRKRDVLAKQVFVPEGCPAIDRQTLWQLAEAVEKRNNSTLAREMDLALPVELSPKEQAAICKNFCQWVAQTYGVAVDANAHGGSTAKAENPHVHVMFTTRRYASDGSLGEKTRELDALSTRKAHLLRIREKWADCCNVFLQNYSLRIDHRSLKDQGIERLPQIHVGAAATAMERRGVQTERGDLNREILAINAETAQLNEEINNGTPMDIGSIGTRSAGNDNSEAGNRGIFAKSSERGGGQRLEQRTGSHGHGASGIVDGQICNNEHEQGGNTPLHVYSAVGATLGNIGTRPCDAEDRCAPAPAITVSAAAPTAKQKRVTDMKDKVRNILYTSDDVCRAALAAVDRRNDQYMAHWLSASKKRHAERRKMAIFKNAVGNVLEVAYLLKKAIFTATDYNDSAFLYEVLNPPEAFVKVPQDDGDDSPQNDMEM